MQQFLPIILTILTIFATCASAQDAAARATLADGIEAASNGDFASALKRFEPLENVAPNTRFSATANYNAGVCLFRLGDAASAITHLERATAIDARYERAHYALGMAFSELKKWDAAVASFKRAVALDPANGETWFDLGLALVETNDETGALDAFVKAYKNGSVASFDAHNNAGILLVRRGETAKAEREFDAARKLSGGTIATVK